MAIFSWVMMGLALWHFTVFLPDRFWAGIVGAFLGALFGSVLVAYAINGLAIPGRDDTTMLTAVEGIPGALLGMGLTWWIGVRRERAAGGA